MRLIFSRNRAAQLDLLLRSLEQNAPPEETRVIWYASTSDFLRGYEDLGVLEPMTEPRFFDAALRSLLAQADPYVTFLCDDDIVFRRTEGDPAKSLFKNERVLAFSWRLAADESPWNWTDLPRTDHGYPGSIDGHTFRTRDIKQLLAHDQIPNPTILETVLARECERLIDERPLLAAPRKQVLVSVPVNRVSEPSGCPFGELHPQPAEALNERFLSGQRIDLGALDFTDVTACHHEFAFPWRDGE